MTTNERFVVGIVQARMASTRLPGKVMKTFPVVGDDGVCVERPCLAIMCHRMRQSREVHQWVIATTVNPEDDVIVRWCSENNLPCSRGSMDDVLDRYAQTVRVAVHPPLLSQALVVRLTSDCPAIDPAEIDRVVAAFGEATEEYATNSPFPPDHRKTAIGLDVEVMKAEALLRAAATAIESYDREHVTPCLRRGTAVPPPLHVPPEIDTGDFRITLDTKEDYEMLRRFFGDLTTQRAGVKKDAPYAGAVDTSIPSDATLLFSSSEIDGYLKTHPDVQAINLPTRRVLS